MLYDKVLEQIIKNKKYKEQGISTGIPYPFGRLNEYLVSIDRGQAIGVLAATGSGKSKFARYTFVYNVYKFYKETGYNCRILFFAMEDGKEKVMNFVICNYLKEIHNISISIKELNSKSRVLPNFVLEKLLESKEYFSEFEKIVTFIDGVTEPDELYGICKKVAMNVGTVTKWKEQIEGQEITQYGYDSDVHLIAVFDNMSNVDMDEDTSSDQEAILKFVKDYMRLKLCNFFKFTCVIVMQLDFESERQSFNRDGQSNISKLEPSLASVGDSKRATRSLHLIFSLFSPHRYELIHYPAPSKANPGNCYRIDILGNRFRSLRIIKSNDTDTGMRVGLLFNGMTEEFEELPLPMTPEIENIYKKLTPNNSIIKENNTTFVKVPKIDKEDELPF